MNRELIHGQPLVIVAGAFAGMPAWFLEHDLTKDKYILHVACTFRWFTRLIKVQLPPWYCRLTYRQLEL